MPRRDSMIGSQLGNYLLVSLIGQGGFGKVYLALQAPLYRLQAALKLMSVSTDDRAMAHRLLEKFQGEARALATLAHPNIVRLLDYNEYDGVPYLAMEFIVDGRPLKAEVADWALRGEMLDRNRSRDIVLQILDGLEAAHQAGVIHRDLKPENVMLQRVTGNPDYVRILDFGLAKFTEDGTHTSVTMGTPAYMAPEQLSRKGIGPWTDLYALGVLTFELLLGRRPFPGRTHREVLAKKLDPDFSPLALVADLQLSSPLQGFLRKAVARDPEDRYRSAAQFRAEFKAALEADRGSAAVDIDGDFTGLVEPTDLERLQREKEALESELKELRAAVTDHAPSSPTVVAEESAGASSRRGGPRWLVPALATSLVAVVLFLVLGLPLMFGNGAGGSGAGVDAGAAVASAPDVGERDPKTSVPKVADPKVADPKVADPKVADPKVADPKVADPKVVDPKVADPKVEAPKVEAPKVEAPKVEAPKTPAPELSEGFVLVPGGSYPVGCKDGQPSCWEQDRYPYPINLTAFSIMRREVTVGEYAYCVVQGRCSEPGVAEGCNWKERAQRGEHPVNCVSWAQARAYCRFRAGDSGRDTRLPREWEWEVAARGADGLVHPWGAAGATCESAWLADGRGPGCGTGGTAPVSALGKDVSPFGVVGLGGNVREWVHEAIAPYPGGTLPGGYNGRIVRGGGWTMAASEFPTAYNRDARDADAVESGIGFRCVQELD